MSKQNDTQILVGGLTVPLTDASDQQLTQALINLPIGSSAYVEARSEIKKELQRRKDAESA